MKVSDSPGALKQLRKTPLEVPADLQDSSQETGPILENQQRDIVRGLYAMRRLTLSGGKARAHGSYFLSAFPLQRSAGRAEQAK